MEYYDDTPGNMIYDRKHLNNAIPEPTIDGTDPEGLLSGDEQQKWNDGYEQVLAVIRAEFRAGQDEFTEGQIMDAVAIANDAWNTYCGFQGDVDATVRAVRLETRVDHLLKDTPVHVELPPVHNGMQTLMDIVKNALQPSPSIAGPLKSGHYIQVGMGLGFYVPEEAFERVQALANTTGKVQFLGVTSTGDALLGTREEILAHPNSAGLVAWIVPQEPPARSEHL